MIAGRIISGDLDSVDRAGDLAGLSKVYTALQSGFGLAMIYGWLGAWAFSAASVFVFQYRLACLHSDTAESELER